LVVEATLKSGSLITAQLAVEQGKEVFAIPGSIHATQSRGCHALIKQGAKLVETAQDILEELGDLTISPTIPKADAELDSAPSLLDHLGFDPIDIDTLIARSGLTMAELSAMLLTLELDGRISALPGGLYQRIN
jgi:DNA processing protein